MTYYLITRGVRSYLVHEFVGLWVVHGFKGEEWCGCIPRGIKKGPRDNPESISSEEAAVILFSCARSKSELPPVTYLENKDGIQEIF